MMSSPDFSLRVVGRASDGAAALRELLLARGLDTTTIAQVVGTSPLTLTRATKTGATPRGVLVGMAVLATVIDELEQNGITITDLSLADGDVNEVVADIAAESPLAQRTLSRLRTELRPPTEPYQLPLTAARRVAA